MKEYLELLSRYFDEEDVEGFNEMKEDLLEQLRTCMEEGQSEEEVVANLPDPKQVAEDYYEDKNIEISKRSKTYVIPKEHLIEEFVSSIKNKSNRMLKLFFKMVRIIFSVLTFFILGYSLIYIGNELLFDKHFAIIPFLISLFCGAIFLFLFSIHFTKYKEKLRLLSIIVSGLGVLLLTIFSLTDQLFYEGHYFSSKFEVETTSPIKIKVNTDVNVVVTVTEVSKSHPLSYVVRGNFEEEDIKKLNSSQKDGMIDLTVNKNSWKNKFTKFKNLEIVFLVPKETTLSDLEISLKKGDVRLTDISSENLNFKINEGDIYFKNVLFNSGDIKNDSADLIIEKSKADFDINNNSGKIVVTDYVGNLSIEDISGISILKEVTSDILELDNVSGRVILEDSTIQKLSIQSIEGQIAVKNTYGELTVKNSIGKIVGEDNTGSVDFVNDSGPTIVIQSEFISGKVKSNTGIIKWLQDKKYPVNINIASDKKTEDNPFANVESDYSVAINSNSDWVRVLEKIE